MFDRNNGQTALNFKEIAQKSDKEEKKTIKLSSFNKN